jgi:hypothetical protein
MTPPSAPTRPCVPPSSSASPPRSSPCASASPRATSTPFGYEIGKRGRPSKVTAAARERILSLRKDFNLAAGQIAELLEQEGVEVSVRTVERVIADAGLPKLPRRTQLLIGVTKDRTLVPKAADRKRWTDLRGQTLNTEYAGIFLFLPFIEQLGLVDIVRRAKLPSTPHIPAQQYILSLLALKLLGRERLSHVDDHNFDPALGLFGGLNILPKCTAISTYSYMVDADHIQRLQAGMLRQGRKLRLFGQGVVNLDFHTIPHYGEESVIEQNWSGAKNKRLKGALTLMAQDAASRLILYSDADIQHGEMADQVLEFVRFWRRITRSVVPTLVFDSKFTTYAKLAQLDARDIQFITLRKRGPQMLAQVAKIKSGWKRIHVPHAKRKYPTPQVLESSVHMADYPNDLRQIVMRGTGHEKPTFLITNDFDSDVAEVVGRYAERWRVENAIAEAVKFFHLNALSSPILVKVHLDVVLTVIADTLYYMLAQQLRGFEECNAPRIYRHFIKGKGQVTYDGHELRVRFPRKAHNPIVRAVPWGQLPDKVRWLDNASVRFSWK